MNNAFFIKTMEKVRKQVWNNRRKKDLFNVRTKLSYKDFFLKFISYENEKYK